MKASLNKHKDKIIAIGECGLDYDRLNYATKEEQLKYSHKSLSNSF